MQLIRIQDQRIKTLQTLLETTMLPTERQIKDVRVPPTSYIRDAAVGIKVAIPFRASARGRLYFKNFIDNNHNQEPHDTP